MPFPISTSPAQHIFFIQLHGDEATAKARQMIEQMRRKGDSVVPINRCASSWRSASLAGPSTRCGIEQKSLWTGTWLMVARAASGSRGGRRGSGSHEIDRALEIGINIAPRLP